MSSEKKRIDAVGHGKPPERAQFRKGRSGNPSGRSKGSKNRDLFLEELLGERLIVRMDNERISMSSIEAMVQQTANEALRGSISTSKDILSLDHAVNNRPPTEVRQRIEIVYEEPASDRVVSPPIEASDDRVGSGRPPKHTRFQKGRSGRPKGRPKGPRSLKDVVNRVLGRAPEVIEKGRVRWITVREAIWKELRNKATHGNVAAAKYLIECYRTEVEVPEEVVCTIVLSETDARL